MVGKLVSGTTAEGAGDPQGTWQHVPARLLTAESRYKIEGLFLFEMASLLPKSETEIRTEG